MAKYNLSQNIVESFTFSVTDPLDNKVLEYDFKYPSVNDFESTKDIDKEIRSLEAERDNADATTEYKNQVQEKIDKLELEKTAEFYKLATPLDHDRALKDVLDRCNIKVVKNFSKMISGEFDVK